MPKLEYTPVNDWTKFNFLGKRLFDFVNTKINALLGTYTGDGTASRFINSDLIPKVILIYSEDDMVPVIWMDTFAIGVSKTVDGTNLADAILGLQRTKQGFEIGNNSLVNDVGIKYYYAILGE